MIQYIQILRFSAAMWVALYHAKDWGFFPNLPMWMRHIVNGGYAGVDIFFVISGVIMALSTQNTPAGPRQAGKFLLTRFSRIYTGWWPALILYYVILKLAHALPADLNLQASAFLYPTNFSRHINGVIWSLVFELYFYILIALSLLLPRKVREGALALLFMALIATNLHYLSHGRFAPEMFPQVDWIILFYAAPLVLEFFAGYFLYRLLSRFPRQNWRWWAIATAVLGSWAVYYGLNKTVYDPGLAGFFHWPARALFIGLAACALVGTALLAPLPNRPVTLWLAKLGDYSFAIYLLHPLVFQVMYKPMLWINPENRHRSLMTLVIMVVLVTASALYYRYIEHPIYQACRRKIGQWLAPRS